MATRSQKPADKPEIVDPFGTRENYANKDELADKGISFDITNIEYERNKGYQGEDRWRCDINVTYSDGEVDQQILTFGVNDKRDTVMEQAQSYLKKVGIMKGYRLAKSGNAYYINKLKEDDENRIPF